MPTNPGIFNRYITIQQKAPARDPDTHEETRDFSDFYSCWAAMMPLVGKETWSQVETRVAEATGKWRIRFFPGIVPTMRVIYIDTDDGDKERHFDILGIAKPYELPEFLDLFVKEIK